MEKKNWCSVCKFMTYGRCHEEPLRSEPERDEGPIYFPSRHKISMPRMILVPFAHNVIHGQASANIEAHPQVGGRPLHLAVDPRIAPNFLINDIKIGRNSIFANWGSISAGLFAPHQEKDGIRENLDGVEEWTVGQVLTIAVTNLNPGAMSFNAVMRATPVW
jgi:hypothetical protein